MAGLPYSCRCSTVTGNIAPLPMPTSTGNGGSGGSGGTPGIRGQCVSNGTPTVYTVPPSDIATLGYGAGVSPSALIGSGQNITLTSPPFSVPSSGCYTLYLQGGGGGGGDAGAANGWYCSDCSPSSAGAPGGPGGIGGCGVFLMVSVYLQQGDTIIYAVGLGGQGGVGSTNTPATPGGNTSASVYRNGQEVYNYIALGGQPGANGTDASIVFPDPSASVAGKPGASGVGGVGAAPASPEMGAVGACYSGAVNGQNCLYQVYAPSSNANWFGNPGKGAVYRFYCDYAPYLDDRVLPTGYGFGGAGGASSINKNWSSVSGGIGFFYLVKYS